MCALAMEKPLEFATAVGTMMLVVELAVLVVLVVLVVGQQRDALQQQQQQQQNFEKLCRDIAALVERSLLEDENK